MPSDTITIELQGEVSLARFRDAVAGLADLVAALAGEHRAGDVRWEIDALNAGSATATVRGVPTDGADAAEVDRVVRSYLEVGRALESHGTVPFSAKVQKAARGIAAVVGDGVEAVRFETAEADALVRDGAAGAASRPGGPPGAYGAVTGRVQTLTSRSRLRFTLYDSLSDRAVSCYPADGMEGEARDIWDKLTRVEGWVSRDRDSGRPLSVRRVTSVTVLDEGDLQGYLRARGALPRGDGPRAEERIRRLRDAG